MYKVVSLPLCGPVHMPAFGDPLGTSEDRMMNSNCTESVHAPSPPQEGVPNVPPSQEAVHMPDEWALPWSNALLRERIEEREREPGCGGGLARRKYHWSFSLIRTHLICIGLPDASPMDPAVGFIARQALKDLADFTFEREAQFLGRLGGVDSIAFSVTDFDRRRQVTLDTRSCSGPNANSSIAGEVLHTLFSPVQSHSVQCRAFFDGLSVVYLEIGCNIDMSSHVGLLLSILTPSVQRNVLTEMSEVNAFTPSALSTILLCAAKDTSHDYATIYAALRRHLSTSPTDRHYNEGHGWSLKSTENQVGARHVCGPFSLHLTACNLPVWPKLILMKIIAFTIPYFSLTERPPSSDQAPLSPSGIFGIDAKGERYIREQKFSVSWSSGSTPEEPSLMVALNPLSKYRGHHGHESGQLPAAGWVGSNLFHIVREWKGLLNSLDEQTTLPVWAPSFDCLWLLLVDHSSC